MRKFRFRETNRYGIRYTITKPRNTKNMTPLKTPKSLQEAILYYSSEVVCVEFLSQLFWGGEEKCCIKCGSTAVYGLRTRPIFKCRDCKKQFSLKSGTIMQNSPLPITKWVPALWMVVNCKNGISSCEMARALNVTQRTAWHMNHRIRESIAKNSGRNFRVLLKQIPRISVVLKRIVTRTNAACRLRAAAVRRSFTVLLNAAAKFRRE